MNYKNLRQWLLIVLMLIANGIIYFYIPVDAASEAKDPPAEPCVHVATADTIKVYRCIDDQEGSMFYVNNLGFMLNEPY